MTSWLQVPPREGCTELSAPGDTVHIHYTVRAGGTRQHCALAGGAGGTGTGTDGGASAGTGAVPGVVPGWAMGRYRGG